MTLEHARQFYAALDKAQQAKLADAFAEAFKARLIDGMTAEELQAASDDAFIDAAKALGGTA